MKVIIAGSRSINDLSLIKKAVLLSGFVITEVVSGCANGVDKLGEIWAKSQKIPIKQFPAEWDNLKTKPVKIKTNVRGKSYNALAGFQRNEKMAQYADALICVICNNSPGSSHMIDTAIKQKLRVYVYEV